MISDIEIKEIKLFKDKNDCCACGACLNICPKQAISMQKDEYGFLYPQIDKGKCIKCGLCLKTCAFQNSELKNIPIKTYAAQSDNTNLKESASGGIFASIATNVLREGGVIYGAAMEMENDKLTVRHIAVENDADLIKLQGSKYVQSSTEKIYQDVKKKLNDNRLVLFSGTPCQVDGLNSYLGKTYDNLITIDIICHGVPNNQMFQDYIALLEEKYKDKIIDFKFRDKTKGWGLTAKGYTAKGYTAKIPANVSSYYYMFLKSYIYRDSCYSCKYACKNRCGDITIGDYWGIEKAHPEVLKENDYRLDYKNGISCLIVNTERGTRILEKYKSSLRLLDSAFEKVANENGQLNHPSLVESNKRARILDVYKFKGYVAVGKLFKWIKCINMLKVLVPSGLKKVLKKMINNFK